MASKSKLAKALIAFNDGADLDSLGVDLVKLHEYAEAHQDITLAGNGRAILNAAATNYVVSTEDDGENNETDDELVEDDQPALYVEDLTDDPNNSDESYKDTPEEIN